MTAQPHILVVEDEPFVSDHLEAILKDAGATTTACQTAAGALATLAASRFDTAILDVHLADDSSYAIADALRTAGTPFVFLSGYLTIREGYADIPFLEKPFTPETVNTALAQILPGMRLTPPRPAD